MAKERRHLFYGECWCTPGHVHPLSSADPHTKLSYKELQAKEAMNSDELAFWTELDGRRPK